MSRRARARLLAVCLSLGLMAVVGEVAARAALGSPWPEREPLMMVRANQRRGWEMVPGLHYTYTHPVRINALGLRGPELEARRPGERRVLVLGDSFVYGQGVAEEDTIPALLQERLAARSQGPVTVVNAGHRAYAMHQELGVLEELGERIQPDDVLVLWFWNDAAEADVAGQYERLTERGPTAFDTGAAMTEGALWTRMHWRLRQLARSSALVMWLYDTWRARDLGGQEPLPPGVYGKRLDGHLEGLQRLTRRLGSRLHVAIVPDPFELGMDERSRPSQPVEAALRAALEAAGIEPIELRPAMRAHVGDGPPPVIPFDGHYLPEANHVMAGELDRALE